MHKEMGLVAQVFDEPSLTTCAETSRWPTAGTPPPAPRCGQNAQPTFRSTPRRAVALGHNGNLTNTVSSRAMLPAERATARAGDVGHRRADRAVRRGPLGAGGVERGAADDMPLVKGAYSLVFMDENTLYAARDPQGFRPLVLGRLGPRLGGSQRDGRAGHRGRGFVREVLPGELISLDERGVAVADLRRRRRRRCACSSTSTWPGRTPRSGGAALHATRVQIGRTLAASTRRPRTW